MKIENNSVVLDKIIEPEEKELFSTRAYQKEIKILDKGFYRKVLSIGIPLLITIIFAIIVALLAEYVEWILSEYSFLYSFLIIGLGTLSGYYIIDFFLGIIIIRRKSLKNVEYFFTQRRIISISTYTHEEYLIISLPYDKIHSYFIKTIEKKPIFEIYFKTEAMSKEEINKCFQTAKKVSSVKNGIVTGLDVIFKLPEKEFLLIWKNVAERKTIRELLSEHLPNKQQEAPIPKSGIMSIEAHLGY